MALQQLDPRAVIDTFREWSLEDQLALVRSLIQELAAHERSTLRRLSVYDLAGIARTGAHIPSDEQIEAWLDERRMKDVRAVLLRALVDTNVMVDLLLRREPWFSQAKPLWDARDLGHVDCAVLASTLTDLYYICRKPTLPGPAGAKMAIEMVIQRFEILWIDRAVIQSALLLPGLDFEDDVQIACAVRDHMDLIVTRNTADFKHPPITSIEPPEIVQHLTTP